MSEFKHGSSSIVRLEAHIAFVTKYRHTVFDDAEFKGRCGQIFHQAAAHHGFEIKEMGFDRDHVHMIVALGATHTVVEVAKALKGTSGRKLLAEFPAVKRRYFWGSGLWSGTIFGDGVGRDANQMTAYVRNQGKPRAAISMKTLTDFLPGRSIAS